MLALAEAVAPQREPRQLSGGRMSRANLARLSGVGSRQSELLRLPAEGNVSNAALQWPTGTYESAVEDHAVMNRCLPCGWLSSRRPSGKKPFDPDTDRAIKIYGFESGDAVGLARGMPDISPFVCKVIAYCRMAGLPFQLLSLADHDRSKSSTAKLPVVQFRGQIVTDSYFILKFLKAECGDVLDSRLGPAERAFGQALTRQIDEWLYFSMHLYTRFATDDIEKFLDLYFHADGTPKLKGTPRAAARDVEPWPFVLFALALPA
eukprot:1884337-Prymnesium_polylepis.1